MPWTVRNLEKHPYGILGSHGEISGKSQLFRWTPCDVVVQRTRDGWSLHQVRKRCVCMVKPLCSDNICIVECIFEYTWPLTIHFVIIHDQIWLSSLSFVHIIKKGLIDIIVIISIYDLSLFSLLLMFSLLSLFMLSLSFMWSILSIIIIHHTSTTTTMIVLWMTITFVNDKYQVFILQKNPWTRPPTSVWTLADLAWRAARDPWGWPETPGVWCVLKNIWLIDIDRYQLMMFCKWLESIHLESTFFFITRVDFYPIVNYHHQTIRVGFSINYQLRNSWIYH